MAKYILKSKRLHNFRGSIRTQTGVDKAGNPIMSHAKYYKFDKFGRLEANDEIMKDLEPYIKRGQIRVINLDEVVDKVDIQKMKRDELIKELELMNVLEIEGQPLAKHNKQKLLDYLEEIYHQKAEEKKE